MCGIAGMVGLEHSDKICESMLKTMHHRGPDECSVVTNGNCCLLHSRLTIIDAENGRQPMTLKFHDEIYTIVYNGELYNTEEIKNILMKLNHTFIGYSDTEVVLHAYAQWSESCLNRLNGIFAFAIWEHKRKKLFIARDRMGVKPLFYKKHDNGIIFSSEIKTILAYPTVKPILDCTGVAEIVLLGPGRTPGSGVFDGIYELEPGCYGYYHSNKWTWQRYWKLTDFEHTDTFDETAEKVRYLVLDAIKRQMVSDVPIGTFLSGGLDSSIISSVCASEFDKKNIKLETFSVDYENNDAYFVPGKFQPNSDSTYIRIMQEYINSDHNWTVLTPEDLIDCLEDATIARDLPGMADVDFSLLAFCKQIREKVKVALSGECADEIFGGYPWYRDPDILFSDGFPWSQNVHQRAELLTEKYTSQVNAEEYVRECYNDTISSCDILPGTSVQEKRMKEMMILNIRWFMQTLLDRKDRMSMHSGLEVRVPFCDYRIAEYLYGVPWAFKEYEGREKGLLRYAMAEYLPNEILYRKKSPYPKTYDPKYFELIMQALNQLLNRRDAPIFEIIDKSKMTKYIDNEQVWPWYGQLMRRPQTAAYMLQLNFWLEHYNIDIK